MGHFGGLFLCLFVVQFTALIKSELSAMSEEEIGIDAAQDETVAEEVTQEESSTSETVESEQSEEAKNDDEQTKKNSAAKRINQLTWKAREAERRAAALEQQLNERQQQETPKASQSPPKLADFDYDEEAHGKAVADYYLSQSREAARAVLQEESRHKLLEQQTRELAEKRDQFFERGFEVSEDFYEVVTAEGVACTDEMADALLHMDKGQEVFYHLAKDPSESQRIASLSPYLQAVELGRLEARLSMPKPKKATSAPPPINPLKGNSSGVVDEDSMSTDEWIAMRNKQKYGA